MKFTITMQMQRAMRYATSTVDAVLSSDGALPMGVHLLSVNDGVVTATCGGQVTEHKTDYDGIPFCMSMATSPMLMPDETVEVDVPQRHIESHMKFNLKTSAGKAFVVTLYKHSYPDISAAWKAAHETDTFVNVSFDPCVLMRLADGLAWSADQGALVVRVSLDERGVPQKMPYLVDVQGDAGRRGILMPLDTEVKGCPTLARRLKGGSPCLEHDEEGLSVLRAEIHRLEQLLDDCSAEVEDLREACDEEYEKGVADAHRNMNKNNS